MVFVDGFFRISLIENIYFGKLHNLQFEIILHYPCYCLTWI